jgi:NADH dehydrogenase FAD-containing subunit
VVVGGGFGGVNVSRVLAKSDVDRTIIDRTNHHRQLALVHEESSAPTITLDQAIDEIGFHGSAAADNTSSDIS